VDIARLSAQWDEAADTFDDEVDHGLVNQDVRQAWMRVLGSLLPDPPARVADLGCGTGSVSVLLAESGYEVLGLDFSPRMIERAQAKAAATNCGATLRIGFRIGDATAPDLADAQFDVVFARHVVWALPDPLQALRRWVQLLAPSGRLVLVEGLWEGGAGLSAGKLMSLLEPSANRVTVHPLSETILWGKEIEDERYALVAFPDERAVEDDGTVSRER